MARQMKDSGFDWIGDIPVDWNIISFWQATERMATGLNPRDNFVLNKDDEFFYVTIRNFKNGKLFLDENCDRISAEAYEIIQQRSQLQNGDILFASISESGNAYIIDNEPRNWNINESVFTIRPDSKRFITRYFYYHLINVGYYTDLRMDATGSTFQSIKQNKLRKSRMVMPPLKEQQKIADYLDSKCAEIDATIAKTKATIEEYKKLKQSIITEAVTKGIHGDRPMKDSGIEWIGDIPVDWKSIKLKHCTYIRARLGWKGLKADEYVDEGYPFLSAFNIINSKLDFTEVNYINQFRYDESPEIKLAINDILLVKDGAGIGKCAIVEDMPKPSTPNGSLAVITVIEHLVPKFIYYYFLSTIFQKYIDRIKDGMGVPHLFQSDLRDIKIVISSTDEQMEIVQYLDEKCTKIDTLIEKKTALLEEMESYKKSVIYEYVTGKKEVL